MNSPDGSFKIETKPGKADKLHIYANGEYAATVDAVYWFSSGAAAGGVLDENGLHALLADIEKRRAYNKALRLLSVRDHCAGELREKLKTGFSDEAAESAVERAQAAGLIDDAAYAQRLSAELFRRKRYAPDRIVGELCARGVDRETARSAVGGLDIDGGACIIELLNTKFSGSLSCEKDVRRTFNALMRLGYRACDIRGALRGLDGDGSDY